MTSLNFADPNGDQARIERLSFMMRDLAEAGKFILHPDRDAESCRGMADAIVSAIHHLAEEQVMLIISEADRLRALYKYVEKRHESTSKSKANA